MRRFSSRSLLPIFIALAFFSNPLTAQPSINFSRVVNNWPTIELYMQPTCAGKKIWFTDKRFFSIRDNGREVGDFELWCPDPMVRCAVSIEFAIEAGGRMRGPALDSMRRFCKAFVALFDNVNDEAAITTFRDVPRLAVPITSDTARMQRGIDSIRGEGPSAVWDGAYAALLDLINEGVNPCRALVLVSTGRDSGSTQTPASVISLATRNRIRIFTAGVGDSVDDGNLRSVADLTDGQYRRNPDAAWAQKIYDVISTIIFSGGVDCLITYQNQCMDGERHVVELSLNNSCGGNSNEAQSYVAPVILSLPAVKARVGNVMTREGEKQFNVPIHIVETELGDTLPAFRCSIYFMEGLLQLDTVFAPKGALLETAPFTTARIRGGVEMFVHGPIEMKGRAFPALLANLQFTVLRSSLHDTLLCPLEFSTWAFDTGCYRSVRANGEIAILPSRIWSVTSPVADIDFDIYPEPNAGSFTVRLRLDAPQAVTIQVRNVLGQIVHESSRLATEGEQNFEMQLGDVPKGLYFLETNIGSRRIVKSITLMR